jgi:serine/threonine-protein kinase HipA
VKFGRGPDAMLARILQLEAPYMQLARLLGARVDGELELRSRALFIPRFDRRMGQNGMERVAQESLASVAGVADFGLSLKHDTAISILAPVLTDPECDIIEYVRRDALSLLPGNRDNHAHNTALQRFEDGRICLSPLYDFAPMMLHPDGIARLSRWNGESGLSPDWRLVIEQCREASGLPLPGLPAALRELRARLTLLPEHSARAGIPSDILERQRLSIDAVLEALAMV